MKIILNIGVITKDKVLIVEYSKQNNRKFHKRIRIKSNKCKSIDEVYSSLIQQCPDMFGPEVVSKDKVLEALKHLNLTFESQQPFLMYGKGITPSHEPEEKNIDPNELLVNIDLNKVSDELNQKAKELMNKDFESRRLKPGDPGYVYDKRVEFAPSESNEWDEDEDE